MYFLCNMGIFQLQYVSLPEGSSLESCVSVSVFLFFPDFLPWDSSPWTSTIWENMCLLFPSTNKQIQGNWSSFSTSSFLVWWKNGRCEPRSRTRYFLVINHSEVLGGSSKYTVPWILHGYDTFFIDSTQCSDVIYQTPSCKPYISRIDTAYINLHKWGLLTSPTDSGTKNGGFPGPVSNKDVLGLRVPFT